jgi:hypothetical protein
VLIEGPQVLITIIYNAGLLDKSLQSGHVKTGAIYNYISRAGRGAGSWGRRNRTRGKKARDQPQKAGGACVNTGTNTVTNHHSP